MDKRKIHILHIFAQINVIGFCLLLLTASPNAQAQEFNISGIVADLESGEPIEGQQINIETVEPFIEFTVYSDGFGAFDISIPASDSIIFDWYIYTLDCNQVEIGEIIENPLPGDSIFTELLICTDTSACEALFSYELESETKTVTFSNESIGYFNEVVWSFGDGQTSGDFAPVHTYMAAGVYEVCLVIAGPECFSTFCMDVQIVETDSLVADFDYEQVSPDDIFTFRFLDLSSGNITSWLWEFGDGNSSGQQFPEHTYQQPGTYEVCLTVSDTINNEFPDTNTKCQLLEITDTINCSVEILVEMDSLSSIPNTYIFSTKHTNEFSQYFWDFGDGQVSNEANPVHMYDSAGVFEVCVTASDNENVCVASDCQMIETPSYHTFAGQLFIGNFPINSPEPQGDVGVAILYRLHDFTWQAVDTTTFEEQGVYFFANKLNGRYLIKAYLTEASLHASDFAPTYYIDKARWTSANELLLNQDGLPNTNIYLTEVPGLSNSGIGQVFGNIYEEEEQTLALDDQFIFLYDANESLITYTQTNSFGYYNFSGLTNGIYYLRAEVTTYFSDMVKVELTDQILSAEADIKLQKVTTVSVDEINEAFVSIYPNPVVDYLYFKTTSTGQIQMQIFDLQGRLMFEENILGNSRLYLGKLQAGSYILKLRNRLSEEIITKKITKIQ